MEAAAQSKQAATEAEAEHWNDSWNKETIGIAFDRSKGLLALHFNLADASDKKTLAVFAVASGIISIAPSLGWGEGLSGLSLAFWILALVAWIGAMVSCYRAYAPSTFRIEPNPGTLCTAEWLSLTPDQFRCYSLRDMGKTHRANLDSIDKKARRLRDAMLWTGGEVLFLALAFLFR